VPFGNRKKNILEDLFSSVLSQFKKYHPNGNMKFNYLGIFQSLKLRLSMEQILSVSLKLNFTPNTLGCYKLTPLLFFTSMFKEQGRIFLVVPAINLFIRH